MESSELLSDEEKVRIQEKLANRINNDGFLQVVCQEERSQLQNKELCISRFYELLRQALTQQKKRKPSKPTKASVRQRLEGKKKQAEKKANRGYRGDSWSDVS